MKKVFSISNILIACAVAFICYQVYVANLDGAELIGRGERQLFHRDYHAAIESFTEAIGEIQRSDTAFFFAKGMTINKTMNRLKAWHGIGSAYAGMKDYKKANEYLSRVLDENSFYTQSKAKRAFVLYRLGDYHGAISDYSDILKAAPNAFYTLYNRGNAYLKLEDYENAFADYTSAVSLSDNGSSRPETLYIHNTLARALAVCPRQSFRDSTRAVALGEAVVKRAEASFDKTRGAATLGWFKDTLAAAYAEAGQFEKAIETMKEAISQIKASKAGPEEAKTLHSHLLLYEKREALTEKIEPVVFP